MKTTHGIAYVLIVFALVFDGVVLVKGGSVPPMPPQAADLASVSESEPLESADALQNPFPTISIPGVPTTGPCCLFQVEKKFEGNRNSEFSGPFNCGHGVTNTRADVTMKLSISSVGVPCDQQPAIIPNGSTLDATGSLIRRNDAFAHYLGDFTITNPAGTVLFRGTIETIDRLGSHHYLFNCEACNKQSHLEGWLVGRGNAATANMTLRALIAARGTVPSPTDLSKTLVGSLDGVIIRCP